MSDFVKEVGGAVRKTAMVAGAKTGLLVGVGASSSIYSTAMAAGTVVFAPPGLLCVGLCVGLPLLGGWAAWKAAKFVTG